MPLFPRTTIVGNLDLDHDKLTKRLAKEFLREGNWHDGDPFNKTQPYRCCIEKGGNPTCGSRGGGDSEKHNLYFIDISPKSPNVPP